MILQKILTFPVKILTGEESGDEITLTLKSKEATNTINYVIQRAYLAQRSNERQGSASTLTRAEVKGGGRKPWRQKGTGRARAGSNRSPLWKGGGVSFGPKPKLYSSKINRKEWQLSLRSLLIAKQKDITIIDNFNFLEYKTSNIIKVLNIFGINLFENTLIVVPKIEEKLLKSTRNIKTIKLIVANNLNLKQILLAKNLLITKDSLKTIEETYNG
uniref:Large ribosomal subunit protein uL4c n=4 Tax=Saccharina TaxID=309357 RepID=A0A8K1W494_9PHAE|nr:50S ribosomal protein L4 [Saccharina japonica]YP_010863402.1 50S ribosomal protein L4 [Saccharina japonica x Saccharina latissima]QOV02282.1 50S ribosomal protein L4 [Saccharina sp. ye-B]UBI41452.1 50S ribosomal protein L4 [Saccharina sp.]UFQ24820.1 50S ribosomal protein L4 [Saccharina sp. Rongfu]WAX38166.1 ribosomal protein L4 [Saccharina japonica cultivar 901]AFC40145.1 50S ribosomal protein L4 [Saccharina japonica]